MGVKALAQFILSGILWGTDEKGKPESNVVATTGVVVVAIALVGWGWWEEHDRHGGISRVVARHVKDVLGERR